MVFLLVTADCSDVFILNWKTTLRAINPFIWCICRSVCFPLNTSAYITLSKVQDLHLYETKFTYTYVTYIQTFKLWTFKDMNLCSTTIRRGWHASLPSVSCCWRSFSSAVSHVLVLLQLVTLLHSMTTLCQLLYCTTVFSRYYTLKSKNVLFFYLFLCICVGKSFEPITVQYYIADCVRYLG